MMDISCQYRNGIIMGKAREYRNTIRAALAAIFVIVILWGGYDLGMRHFYAARMPAKLELGQWFWHETDGPACGVAAFSLSDATIRSIRLQGIGYFDDIKTDKGKIYYFRPWRETPLPDNPARDAYLPIGLLCAKRLNFPIKQSVFLSMQRPGSFYTGDNLRMIIVLPNEHLVLLSYFD